MKRRKAEEEDYGYLNEEESAISLPMVIGGVVLIVVIIVLCALLWQLLHKEKPAGATSQTSQTMAEDTLVNQGIAGKATQEAAAGKDATSGAREDGDSGQGAKGEGTQEAESVGGAGGTEQEAATGNAGDTQKGGEADSSGDNAGASAEAEGTGEGAGASGAGENQATGPNQGVIMTFQNVEETVTAKDVTNLRSEPSTASGDTVVAQLNNGETAKRTGINETTGWSRLEYEGVVLYASSRLLTTDLTAKPENTGNQGTTDSNTVTTAAGRTITFTPCDDTVSPKMEVNLRNEPSTNQGDDTVHYRLLYGETVHRTGYDDASGWSRVEYDGKVLYVVTSLIYVVEEQSE